ncbi:MAG: hypothetical protein ABIO80_02855 [Sphingomicrobium sp.]
MFWLGLGPNGGDQDDEDGVIEVADSDDGDVDAPVTSGSDPTNWDPIDVSTTP